MRIMNSLHIKPGKFVETIIRTRISAAESHLRRNLSDHIEALKEAEANYEEALKSQDWSRVIIKECHEALEKLGLPREYEGDDGDMQKQKP